MQQLKRLREARGLSQVKLAARADVDPSTVNQIERGAREASPATLRKLAEALDVSIAELIEDASPKVSAPRSRQPSFENHLREQEREERRQPTERNIKALHRWLAYNERRLDEGNLSRDEIGHELDAPLAFEKPISEYPDELFNRFIQLVRRLLEEGKSFDTLQAEFASLEADMNRLVEVREQAKEHQ
jgi:transcriptional regulator with XRE-family HTH domain